MPLQATRLTFSTPPLLPCCHCPLQHWVFHPLPLIVSSTAQFPCIVRLPLLLRCPLPNCLALCPLPPSSCCVVGHPIASCLVLCSPIASHHPPPARLVLSAPPPLVVFSTAYLRHVVYLPLLLCYPLLACPLHTLPWFDCFIHPPLFAPTASLSIAKAVEHHLQNETPLPITTVEHRFHLSPPPPSPMSITAVKHCLAAVVKRHLCCHRSLLYCLHLSLSPPSPLSIVTVKHHHPPLTPAATAVKCHLCHHCCPLLPSITTSIELLQMTLRHLNVSAHCRWWRL